MAGISSQTAPPHGQVRREPGDELKAQRKNSTRVREVDAVRSHGVDRPPCSVV